MYKKKRITLLYSIAVLIISLLFILMVFGRYGKHYLNSDISSQMVFGAHLNRVGGIFSKEWYYSTEVEVANSGHLYQLALKLFPNNWHMARTFVVFISALLLSTGFLYMIKVLPCDKNALIITLAAILLPFSSGYMFLMTYGCFYQIFTATVFFDIGIVLRMKSSSIREGIRLVFFLGIINIVISLSGIRMLMFSAVPITAACSIIGLMRLLKSNTLCEFFRSEEWTICWTGILNDLFILTGFFINKIIIEEQLVVDDYTTSILKQFSLGDVLIHIQYIPEYLGFVGEIPLFSITGITSFLTIILFVYIVLSNVALVTNKTKQFLSIEERFLVLFGFASVFFGILMNVSTSKGRLVGNLGVSYYMPGFLIAILISFLFLLKIECKSIRFRYFLVTCLFLCYAEKSWSTVRDNMQSGETQYEETANWLVDHGYTEGFATFWNGNVLTEASDGIIEVWVLWDFQNAQIYKWLQKIDHSVSLPEGKCFVYVTSMQIWDNVIDTILMDRISKETVILPCDDRLYLFDSGKDFMEQYHQAKTHSPAL